MLGIRRTDKLATSSPPLSVHICDNLKQQHPSITLLAIIKFLQSTEKFKENKKQHHFLED
jgi:uncharacterized phage-like protein YoqJ